MLDKVMSPMRNGQVIKELGGIVGNENIVTESDLLTEAQTATYKTDQKILGIVKPANVEQVQEVVRVANKSKIPMYVYSTGKNWGYGSRIPHSSGSFLIDLGRLNRISDYNEELGYVRIEPGVTQLQLYNFLQENKAPFSFSITGSSPDTSIIGNICERGVGFGPYGFRSHHISDLEVILPTGECLRTGYGRFANAKAAAVYPEGIGPSFQDMFLQSNYGIITKLTMFLAPTPTYSQIIKIAIARDEDLADRLTLLHKFSFYSTSAKIISFRTDLQMLLLHTQYPWHLTNKTPLPDDIARQLKQKYDINYAWKAVIFVYGYTRQEVAAQISHFKSLAANIDGVTISKLYNERTLGSGPQPLSNSCYWRMKTKPPEVKKPDTDGCGLIRLSIAVPFSARHITAVTNLMKQVTAQFGYEPFIEGHCISQRTALVIAPIIYDRTVPGEDENALKCHDQLLTLLMAAGYYPYRDNGRAMTLFPIDSEHYASLQRSIKNALDRNSILSPGKYEHNR